ncbi:fluoride efflux transporter CrcB [Pseudidiomarina taiwanensis]|uniref:Fluoride-specific ion channel FluC n=1 Tax=Pseudidiomarina taiwanensis TaxID=337250 RepID=A0A432ZN79_9GAMM|nr:fluoride efflux transporter CrcB [Pseudidiomarina taiwanensis]RUO79326.1 fluoride efflux transporter CrcB [Pseudidiomarina taiwanensis]
MSNLIWVALGGALGAVGRYLVGKFFATDAVMGFPFATLIVNIVGCFALAFLYAHLLTATGQQQQHWLFLGVGLIGAFTTFSTFSLEFVLLAQQGEFIKAASYASLSFIGCLLATVSGLWLKANI